MFQLRDLPTPQMIRLHARRYPQIDPSACEACLTMLRVASDVLVALESYLARHGMSQGRFTVLMLLNRDPASGLSPSDLAERAGVKRATITGLIDGLERDGLVRREDDCADRRRMTVRLTARGRQYLDARLPDYFRKVSLMMSGLKEPERKLVVTALKKIATGVGALLDS